MTHVCSINCIVPPHMLRQLLKSSDPEIRRTALSTLLATSSLRGVRAVVSEMGFLANSVGEKRRTLFDCKSGGVLSQAKLVRGEGDKPASDNSVNEAYDALGSTYDFYQSVFNRNSIDNKGMRLDGYVHYLSGYNNAFWNGQQMIFGDGDGKIFTDFTGSLDVVAHELTHGVTQFTAGLAYHNQSGALNESVSDVFGSCVKQWKKGQDAGSADWLIGEGVLAPGVKGLALRSMKDPGSAYDDPHLGKDPQPGHMAQFVQMPDTEDDDWGGVHINSGIPNHAFYYLATKIGGKSWEAPGHIWFEALKMAEAGSDFAAFASLTYQAAARLYGSGTSEQQAVVDSWNAVGVQIPVAAAEVSPPLPAQVGGIRPAPANADLLARMDNLSSEVKLLTKRLERGRPTPSRPVKRRRRA
jgi:Zn-dependent metalloprotease